MSRVALTALFILLGAGAATGQQGTSEIRGRVLDAQGAVLPGVAVVIRNQDTGMFRETTSNPDGTYFISSVVPGRYEIAAELQGFKKYQRYEVRLEVGRTTSLDVQLEVGTVTEAVTVTAETPLVDVTSKEVGGNISSRDLVELPSLTRSYIGFIGLLPGIVPTTDPTSFGSEFVSVNGQDPRMNNYLFDGGNNNDDVVGQRGGTQARTPIESIQEFQVITTQYDAEFGRTTGAVINAVTRQGTNQLRGSGFYFLQDDSLTAKDYFARKQGLSKAPTEQKQFGGTVGGPIVRDRAHFFFSLERVSQDLGVTINIPARPDLNTTTAWQTRVWNTLLRYDQQLSANHQWNVRWLRDQSPQFNQARSDWALSVAGQERDVDSSANASLSSVLGNTRVNTLRAGWTQEDVAFANREFINNGRRQDLVPPRLDYATYSDGGSTSGSTRYNNAFFLDNTFSWFVPNRRGDHDLKLGLNYQYSSNRSTAPGNLNGTFSFRTDRPFNPADPSTYPERLSIRVPAEQRWYLKAHHISLFGQDKWRMNNRLTLSLGLRYDLEVMPIREVDNPAFTDAGDYPLDAANLGPRLGFTYAMDENRSAVRGGYGLFHDKTHMELISPILTAGVFSDSFIAQFPADRVDPGPSTGQLPTDPMLRGGPVVNRDLLNLLFPPGSTARNIATVTLDSPDRRVPYAHQATVGFERQLWPTISMSVDYVRLMARDLFMTRDLNPGVRLNTSRTGRIDRRDPGFASSVLQIVNEGKTDYDSLQMLLEKRYSHGFSARVSYAVAYARGNTSAAGRAPIPFQLLDDLRLDLNEGPTDFDRRHNFVLSGSASLPHLRGLTFSWVARAMSGTPFTVHDTSTDPDRNGTLFDPLPGGEYSGSGEDAITVDSQGGRNGAYGPGYFQLDLRLGYRLARGNGRTLDLFAEVFNATNRVNFLNPSGDRRLSTFLVRTTYRTGAVPTTLQLGARLGF